MKILITGGAGFVGSSLAKLFQESKHQVTCFDNLKRRGSEINLREFKRRNIAFIHGDVRSPADLFDLPGSYDVMIEASAEPSVLAGLTGSPDYLMQTNLIGAYNCLEYLRKKTGGLVFLSTSRVYSLAPLKEINLTETETRFEISQNQTISGVSTNGISELFPTDTARSLYGFTKLAAEQLIQEYCHAFGLKAVINRCGVIAGPGQFGKVDQGVFTLWAAHHFYKKPLKYTGFGGTGKQVRDLLHPHDLFKLIQLEIEQLDGLHGDIFTVGGGRKCSTSMMELTKLCQEGTESEIAIPSDPTTSSVDIPLYLSDNSKVKQRFVWEPKHSAHSIISDICGWIKTNADELAPIFN